MLAVLVIAAPVAWAQAAPAIEWQPVVEVRQRASLTEPSVADGQPASGLVEQRARVGLEVSRLGVSARVSFQDVRTWTLETGPVTPEAFAPTIAEGWVRVEGDLTRNVGAVATVGRQKVVIHEGRIVGEDDFSAAGRFLDAVRIVGRAAPVSVEYVEARRFGDREDPMGYGARVVRVGASGENPVTAWVADALWVEDARGTDEATSTLGTYLRFDSGRWRGRADGYLQYSGAGTATLLGLSAGWVFGPNERLVAHLRYDALSSGDDDAGAGLSGGGFTGGVTADGGAAAWRPVLGDTHQFNGLLDRFAAPGTRPGGLSDLQLRVDARPAPQLALGFVGHRFWSPLERALAGTELDASAAWAFSPFASARAVGGWYAPDSPDADVQRLFGYVELDATF